MPTDLRHRIVSVDDAPMHLVESGPEDGRVVVLCHGFPETWYSWRHQLAALGAAGYRAVALDMRGYGRSHQPHDVESYTTFDHVGDVVGVLDALDVPTATVVGHDHGAPVAWTAALTRPDRFLAVAGLSVPPLPRLPVRPAGFPSASADDDWFYVSWFQQPGVAEAVLDADPARFLRGFFYTLSGDCPGDPLRGLAGGSGGDILSRLEEPRELPEWLTEDDVRHYAEEFERTGFRGPLNWYRCNLRTWELGRAWADRRIEQPSLFLIGERDCVAGMIPGVMDLVRASLPGLVDGVLLPGCGHWTQQERPDEVNAALLAFLERTA